MDLTDLRTFLMVAEERHFGRAAERLGISLAQVSQRVRRLEDYLEARLLTRTTRTVTVTTIGQELISEGTELIMHVDRVDQKLRRLGLGQDGALRLGAIGSVSYTLLPRLAQIIEQALPNVQLKITAGMFTPAQEQALREHVIDLGLLRLPLRIPGLAYRIVDRDPLVLALAAEHPLAKLAQVRVADLCGEAFVTYPDSSRSVVREAVFTHCARAGFVPYSLVEVSDTAALIGLVAAGIGVALVPRSAQNLVTAGVKFTDLGLTDNIEIALAWRRTNTSAVLKRALGVLEEAGVFIGPESSTEDK